MFKGKNVGDESISEIKIQAEKLVNKRKGLDKTKIDTIAEEEKSDVEIDDTP